MLFGDSMESDTASPKHPSLSRWHILFTVSFIVGIIGNLTALWILHKSRRSKHVLMLKCLATNDLIAEVGMLTLLYLQTYQIIHVRWTCILFVCLRAFGLGSGCVALVMAIERWLALTRPFFYQQMVTHDVIRKTIFSLWLLAALLTFLPLFGFGTFYHEGRCCRYREAEEYKDKIYAYLFLAFGTTLCIFIAFCNTSVFCALAGTNKKKKKVLVRRVSRSIINRTDCKEPIITSEELAFAKLMAILCVIFITCWLPQMIAIPLAQTVPRSYIYKFISKLGDMVMCIYFTLDPYVYVLHKYLEKGKLRLPFRRKPTKQLPLNVTSSGTPTSILIQPPNFVTIAK